MYQTLKSLSAVALFVCLSSTAMAETVRTVKFESRYNKRIKGAECQVTASGKVFEIVTPARVKLPLDPNGYLQISQISCELQGVKRQTDFFPNELEFQREIYGITVKFKGGSPAFSYHKKNGGLAVWFSSEGRWVPVR
ncbi:MAG: hypothetical protein ACU0A6_17435 [Shimia sp.]|jgi:hypothetical protein|uniref:hypothetical protein n=1 Tax=Shimia sp. TaxID=1954381 RepID=UPI0040587FA2